MLCWQLTREGRHAVARRQPTSKKTNKATQRQLTIMLVTVCVAAICMQLPYMILYTINDRKTIWWPDRDGSALYAWLYAAKEITEAVSIANYAVNFFLYCVSGSAFRRHVRKTLCVFRQSTTPVGLQVRHQNADNDDEVARLADRTRLP